MVNALFNKVLGEDEKCLLFLLKNWRNFLANPVFTVGRTWKCPWCPSTDEWIKEMWDTYMCTYTHMMEYYSAIKRNSAICSNMDRPRDNHIKWSQRNIIWYHLQVGPKKKKKLKILNSLVVKWLGLYAFFEETQVQSLIGKLRSHNMHGVARKKKQMNLFTK